MKYLNLRGMFKTTYLIVFESTTETIFRETAIAFVEANCAIERSSEEQG